MPDQNAETPSHTIHPRLDGDVRLRLDAYCRTERRSINSAVNKLLDDALAAYEAANTATSEGN